MRESNYIKLPTFTNIYTKSLLSLMVLTCPYQHVPTISSALLPIQSSPGSCLVVVEQLPR
jgi:hypothetical protein